jgi:hypothetical protein
VYELLLEDELELDEEEEVAEDESLSSSFLARAASCAFSRMSFGAFLRNSRRSSVSGPNPIDVKKLIAYRVFRTLSLGNMPANQVNDSGSSISKRFFSLAIPIASAIS